MKLLKKILIYAIAVFCAMAFSGICGEVVELKRYALDGLEGIISQTGVTFDPKISSDGNGSLKMVSSKPQQIRLVETGDLDIENARLIYSARIRTQDLDGKAYLEMLCHFKGKGEFFSRALNDPISGTTGWSTQETPFFLRAGENPDNIKLNLIIEGVGTVWIDDVVLKKAPL